VRVTFYQLPFTCLPQVLVIILVTEATKKLNYVPAKHGISKYYSPRMIVHKTGLDYKKHCIFATGSYVQANHDDANRKNTTAPRTLDGIYLTYNTAHQGEHEILHLPTYKIISRSFCTKIPMTKQVIDHVNTIGSNQGMPTGLKIENRYKTTLYDSDWIAGVDYADTNNNNSDADSDKSEDSDESKDSDRSEDSSDDHGDDNSQDYDDQKIAAMIMATIIHKTTMTSINRDISDLLENNKEETHDNTDDKNYETVLEVNVQESVGNETTEDAEKTNENDIPEITTRSGRRVTRPTRYPADEGCNHFLDELDDKIEKITDYDCFEVKVIGTCMMHYQQTCENEFSFIQQYGLMKGLKLFGKKGRQAALKEVKQLHDREVFEPISIDGLTKLDKERAMESIAFLTKNAIKPSKRGCVRMVAHNGNISTGMMRLAQLLVPTLF